MNILAIDPGNTRSAVVGYDSDTHELHAAAILPNSSLLSGIESYSGCTHLAIEMVACYGMPVGREVFDTCLWVGRFVQAWQALSICNSHTLVYRRHVKLWLCNSARAKDSNVRQALLDKFPATGGGKTPQVGTKSQPGPLYGVAKDIWAALGVAVTFTESPDFAEARRG